MIDIDHFKAFNDTYGHAGGTAQTQPLLERIRRTVEASSLPVPSRDHAGRLTVSIGVAIWPDDAETPEEILSAADRRLYQAKQGGRNLVVGPPIAVPPLSRVGT